jgi:hypothetical protein
VSENCPYSGAIGSIKKVDTQTNQVVGSITLNGTPDHCKVISPDGTYIYVASIYDYVYKIQTSDLKVVSSIYSNGIGVYNALSLSPSGDRLYVQTSGTNQVHVFNTSIMSELQSITLPCISSGFFVSPDGSHALMSEVGTPLLDVYSLETGSILKKIDLSAYDTMAQSAISSPYWDIDTGRVLYVSSEGIAVLIPEASKVVTIDIKPGSYPNAVNLGSQGLTPVAILSEIGFDARTVNPATVNLSGALVAMRGKDKYMSHEEDVNKDGLVDLVVQVVTCDIDPGKLQQDGDVIYAVLTGSTVDGTAIEGEDEITIVPAEQ